MILSHSLIFNFNEKISSSDRKDTENYSALNLILFPMAVNINIFSINFNSLDLFFREFIAFMEILKCLMSA